MNECWKCGHKESRKDDNGSDFVQYTCKACGATWNIRRHGTSGVTQGTIGSFLEIVERGKPLRKANIYDK